MSRMVIPLLVWMLSGLPAAAVVCDLVLCPDRARPVTAKNGCHDHAGATSDTRMVANHPECTHLLQADPYLASAYRELSQAPAPTLEVETVGPLALISLHPVDCPLPHGPPRPSHATRHVPLRI